MNKKSKIQSLDLCRPPSVSRETNPPPKSPNVSRETLYRQYAAAQFSNFNMGWNPANATVNEEIESSSVVMRARIRQLVRDNPHFSNAVMISSAYIVGSGIAYQSKVVDAEGNLQKKINQYIEDKYNWFLDGMDIAGRLHGYDFQDLDIRQTCENGEFLNIRHIDRKSEMPLKYQAVEPDSLAGYATGQGKTNEISQGIEYNPHTYQAFRYHFIDDTGKDYSKPADQIVHGFHPLRPNQLRGISPWASGVLLADAFRQYIGSELQRKAMAARYLGIVQSPNIDRWQGDLVESSKDPYPKLEGIENASMLYTNLGETVTFPTPPNDSGIADMSKLMLEMYSVACGGLPYELISGDYGSMSFSTAKIKRTDFKTTLKPVIARFCRQQCEPIKRDFFRFGVLSGYLDLPGYWDNPQFYEKGVWQSPGMEPVDLMREVKATIDEIKARLRSPQEYIRSRGADPEKVLAEIAEFKEMAEDKGLTYEEAVEDISTMMQQNPAKLNEVGKK